MENDVSNVELGIVDALSAWPSGRDRMAFLRFDLTTLILMQTIPKRLIKKRVWRCKPLLSLDAIGTADRSIFSEDFDNG